MSAVRLARCLACAAVLAEPCVHLLAIVSAFAGMPIVLPHPEGAAAPAMTYLTASPED